MGRYIEQSDLEKKIPPQEFLDLFDRNADGVADPEIIAGAISAAESYLHGFLAGRYVVPLDATDLIIMDFIRPMLVDLAWQEGYLRPDMVENELLTRISAHTKRLEAIRNGDSPLPMTTQPSSIRFSADPRRFKTMP